MRTFRLPGGMRPRLVSAAAVVVALALLAFFLAPSRSGSAAVATSDAVIALPESPGSDETVEIDTTLYLPESVPAPAVLLAHGFGGSKDSVAGQARSLAEDGFVVLTYSARGFGRSTGAISINDPAREVADARGLVDWLAGLPQVQLDGPADPRVGVAGGSYGGALALSLGGTDRRIDAIAASITWNDLGQALFPNAGTVIDPTVGPQQASRTPAQTPYGGPGVLKRGWAGVLFSAGSAQLDQTGDGAQSDGAQSDGAQSDGAQSDGAQPDGAGPDSQPSQSAGPCGRFAVEFCDAYAVAAITGKPTPELLELLRSHSPAATASNITAPTLLVQGEQDTLFGLDQADATARQIAQAGGQVQVRWFNGGHDAGGDNQSSNGAIQRFLEDKLRASPSSDTAGSGTEPASTDGSPIPFSYSLPGTPAADGQARSRRMTAPSYPGLANQDGNATPTAAVQTTAVTLTAGEMRQPQAIARPPGASPAAVSSIPGLGSILSQLTATDAGQAISGDIPGQAATFRSEPLAGPLSIIGGSRVDLTIAAQAFPGESVLFVKLYDVGPNGRRILPGSAVSAIRLPDAHVADASGRPAPITVSVTLPAVAYQLQEGHQLELSVSTTDQAYAMPVTPARYTVALASGTLAVPSVPGVPTAREIALAPVIGIASILAALALLVAASAVRTRRRVAAEANPALENTPLVITDLTKTYSNGFRAVDGVSFELHAGQVLGLLGPNGAGKTTTLRMLIGLISPTSGEIRVFGHKVSAGAPVLSRLGSFVEGSGFLPHLSGIDNLRLYWAATGRPTGDAHLDEALDIAALGPAVNRKVRSYSQGMRQRLAIAQAMLGLPDLLVLDEPINGLDPPQIRAMREVLINYARTGRTVLVSSHLLAEVEQTCTHVVVMHHGKVISAGTVHDLLSNGGPTQFTVDDADRAAMVLAGIPGLGTVEIATGEIPVVRADLVSVDVGEVVHRLVEAGVGVRGVSRATRLEDVFLDLVHTAQNGEGIQ